MLGENAFAPSQDFKSAGHPSDFDQSMVAAALVLLTKMVQHHAGIDDGFLKVVHLVVSKAIGRVHHPGAKRRVGLNIAPYPKV